MRGDKVQRERGKIKGEGEEKTTWTERKERKLVSTEKSELDKSKKI